MQSAAGHRLVTTSWLGAIRFDQLQWLTRRSTIALVAAWLAWCVWRYQSPERIFQQLQQQIVAMEVSHTTLWEQAELQLVTLMQLLTTYMHATCTSNRDGGDAEDLHDYGDGQLAPAGGQAAAEMQARIAEHLETWHAQALAAHDHRVAARARPYAGRLTGSHRGHASSTPHARGLLVGTHVPYSNSWPVQQPARGAHVTAHAHAPPSMVETGAARPATREQALRDQRHRTGPLQSGCTAETALASQGSDRSLARKESRATALQRSAHVHSAHGDRGTAQTSAQGTSQVGSKRPSGLRPPAAVEELGTSQRYKRAKGARQQAHSGQ
jgi:hypothetical protein